MKFQFDISTVSKSTTKKTESLSKSGYTLIDAYLILSKLMWTKWEVNQRLKVNYTIIYIAFILQSWIKIDETQLFILRIIYM